VSPTERAKAAHAAAEAAEHPRDKAALKAAAGAWEQIARGGTPWSHRLLWADLRQLQRDFAVATGPFQHPAPPKAPAPSQVPLVAPPTQRIIRSAAPQEATIAF
jgi:hypothetical protein